MESRDLYILAENEIDSVGGGNQNQYDAGVALGHAVKDFFAELGKAIEDTANALNNSSGGTGTTGVVW